MTRTMVPDRLTVATALLGAVLIALDRRLQRGGRAGIIAFEVAGSAARSSAMVESWDVDQRRTARLSLVLDNAFAVSYGAWLARALGGRSAVAARLACAASAFDVVENVTLLAVLQGRPGARLAQTAALTKFALLGAALGDAVAAGIGSRDA